MRAAIVALLLTSGALGPAMAASRDQPASAFGKTGKERLSDKGSSEQRVDDCKVPPSERTRPRPTACPWQAGARPGTHR